MRRVPVWRLLAALVFIPACAMVSDQDDQGNEPTPGPDAVLIRVHTTGGERNPESVFWLFQGPRSPDESGVVSFIPEGTCIAVSPDWSLQVTEQTAGVDPVLKVIANSGQFSGESPLDLAIERTEGGQVTVTEGQPDWWPADDPIGCASG